MEPWLIVVVVAAFLLIAFGTRMIHRISVRSDGENSELTAEAPRRKRTKFKMRNSKNIRTRHKARGSDVEIEGSDFTDSSTDIR